MNRVRLGGSSRSGVLISGPTTSITGPTTYQALATDSTIRVTAGPATINLASAATGVQDGQLVYIIGFDVSGNLITINAAAGDNINGAGPLSLAEYGAYVVLKARVASGVVNWTIFSTNPFDRFPFSLQPTLAAGAQGPLSLGYVIVPQGVRFLKLAYFGVDVAVAGSALSIAIHGLQNDPQTLSMLVGNTSVGQINSPGNNNWKTTQNLLPAANGTRVQATVTTIAGFSGPTTVFGGLEFWS